MTEPSRAVETRGATADAGVELTADSLSHLQLTIGSPWQVLLSALQYEIGPTIAMQKASAREQSGEAAATIEIPNRVVLPSIIILIEFKIT